MKVVILAGGKGRPFADEASLDPGPMAEIGGWPVLWHLMNVCSAHGLNDFIICCGRQGSSIKKFFENYALRRADVTFDFVNGSISYHVGAIEPWRVTLVDTGEETMSGGRIRHAAKYLDGNTFCCSSGDSLCDVDIRQLINFHRNTNTLATLVAIPALNRFGGFTLNGDDPRVGSFRERPRGPTAWVNGGFFVLQPEALAYIDDDLTVWEREPMRRLSDEGQLSAFRHDGFWHTTDTPQDLLVLREIWSSGKAPWRVEALRAAQEAAVAEHGTIS